MDIPSYIPADHFFTDEDLPLFEVTATFAYCQVLLKENKGHEIATFDLTVRDLPKNRNFMIFGGLEEIVCKIKNWRFSSEQIDVLKKTGLIGSEMAEYLSDYKFSGSIEAMPEGTVFFPGEPILRLTAPIVEANLFYVFFVNCVPSYTIFMSKAIRSVIAAEGKTVVSNGGRALGFEAGAKYVRSAYLTGISTRLQLSPLLKYKIDMPKGLFKTTFHAFIKAFPTEMEAFKAFVKEYPDHEAGLMIDTYDIVQGLKNAIEIGIELKKNGKGLAAIFIDSGDLVRNSKHARKCLDKAGLTDVKIVIASNIDEWKIAKLIRAKAPVDFFMAITELTTVADDPKLEIVYKMAELRDGEKVRYTMKHTPGKRSLPGRKQVYRFIEKNVYTKDVIGLDGGKNTGQPLLVPIFEKGKLVYTLPKLDYIKEYIEDQVAKLPEQYKKLTVQRHPYKVDLSAELSELVYYCNKSSH